MGDPDDIKSKTGVTSGDPVSSTGSATIDPPPEKKDGQLDLEAKSVRTIADAWNICKAAENNNRARAARTADLQAIHDGEPPRSASANLEKGKAWQSNFSTLWLAGIVGRVSQRFINAIVSQLTVTQSQLPDSIQESKRKSDLMTTKFTKLVRGWTGYTGLINSIEVETVLQGYAYVVFLDPYTWKPTFIKQDRCFVPEGSQQHARDLQWIVAKMDYRLDEFLDLFAWDEKHAEDVGYNLENCVYAANHAVVQDPRDDATVTQYRKLVEMVNEGVLGLTYTSSGARVVNCYLLFNREYDGKVSFWLIHRETGKLLRFSLKIFPQMQDVCALFAFEPGNGCIHSSKGMGRKLGALSIAKELFRNGVMDNSRMSGMLLLQADSKDKSRAAPQIMSPFVMLDKTVVIPQQQFPSPAEGYEKVDLATDGWAEQATGAFIATNAVYDRSSTEKTATQAQIEANQSKETADIQIRRNQDQFANMTQIQQYRAFSDDNIKTARRIYGKLQKDPTYLTADLFDNKDDFDGDLIRTLVEIMQSDIADEEIKMWRRSPASIYAHIQDTAVMAGVAAVAAKYAGNPNVDQQQVLKYDIEGMVGPELAAKFVVPNLDQTVKTEATRAQLIESSIMYDNGMAIPVSARDNHLVHAATVQQLLSAAGTSIMQSYPTATPQQQKALELCINHMGEHLQFAQQQGLDKQPEFKQLKAFYEGFKKDLQAVAGATAEVQAHQQVVQDKIRQEGLPPVNGAGQSTSGAADNSDTVRPAVGLEAQIQKRFAA